MVQVEREEKMIQWKDAELFKAGVAIQESGTLGDVRAHFSNFVFFPPYFCGCTLVLRSDVGKFVKLQG